MKIGVVGAGTMGAGIAQAFAVVDGYDVVLCDTSEELATGGKARIETALKRLTAKGKLEQSDMDSILARITTGLIDQLVGCDLVVEAALENMQVKKELFQKLQGICKKDTIFTTNTSSLSLTELSKDLDRAVIGMHFFNPAPVMKLVEVIAGLQASEDMVDRVLTIAKEIGNTPVRIQEGPGFVVNRILIPMINEAAGILAEGLATAEDIDTAMKLGANHPMGPLALGDLVGLDVCLAIMEVLHEETGDSKYRPHPLMRKMVRGGMLGRKTGRGFYTYAI